MKMICMIREQWQNRVPQAELERIAGGAGSSVRSRALPAGEDKVVNLAAWKAENLIVPDEPETGRVSAPGRYGDRRTIRRRRRLAAIQNFAELTATLAVTAALAALVLRVLLF